MTTAQPGQEQRMVTDAMIEAALEVVDGVDNSACARIYLAMHAARPTADLGEDLAAMLYQEAGQLDDLDRANAIRQAADRIELYREALEAYVVAHDAWIKKDAGINAAIHAADAVVKASNNARAVLSRSGG